MLEQLRPKPTMHVPRLADFFYSRKGLGVFSTDFLRRAYNYTRTDVIIHNVIIGFPFLTLVASICSGWWDLVEVVADLCKIVAWVSSGYKKFLRLIVNTSVLVPICCKIFQPIGSRISATWSRPTASSLSRGTWPSPSSTWAATPPASSSTPWHSWGSPSTFCSGYWNRKILETTKYRFSNGIRNILPRNGKARA